MRKDEGIVHVKRLEEIVGWCGIGHCTVCGIKGVVLSSWCGVELPHIMEVCSLIYLTPQWWYIEALSNGSVYRCT